MANIFSKEVNGVIYTFDSESKNPLGFKADAQIVEDSNFSTNVFKIDGTTESAALLFLEDSAIEFLERPYSITNGSEKVVLDKLKENVYYGINTTAGWEEMNKKSLLVTGINGKTMNINFVTEQVKAPYFTKDGAVVNGGKVLPGSQISIATKTENATIVFTTDGTNPTRESEQFASPILIGANTVIKAFAFADGLADSDVVTIKFESGVPTVTATPAGGNVEFGSTVTLTAEEGTIHYTIDGKPALPESSQYMAPIPVYGNMQIRAVAVINGAASKESVYNYTSEVPAPTADVPAGEVKKGTTVTLAKGSEVDGLVTHYTLNGATPDAQSDVYSVPFTINETTTLKAINIFDGKQSSKVATFKYIVAENPTCATPVASPVGGEVVKGTQVGLTCGTPGAVIHFTDNGTPATADSPVYSEKITVNAPMTIRAVATAEGYKTSAELKAAYTVKEPPKEKCKAPEVNKKPTPGGDTFPVSGVTLTSATATATINYTTDGSVPSAVKGTKYTTPITISGPTELKAIAFEDGKDPSEVVTFKYTAKPEPPKEKVATPTISPNGGDADLKSGVQVTISCATPGATIKYTTDGSEPSPENGTIITSGESFQLKSEISPKVVKAIATKTEMTNSDVAEATFKQPAPQPGKQTAYIGYIYLDPNNESNKIDNDANFTPENLKKMEKLELTAATYPADTVEKTTYKEINFVEDPEVGTCCYVCYAIPQTLGTITKIYDKSVPNTNILGTIEENLTFAKRTKEIDGVAYDVYAMTTWNEFMGPQSFRFLEA